MTDELPQTLVEAVRYFADLAVCNDYMRRIKWPGGIVCPHCESRRCVERHGGKRIRCKDCRTDFSYKVDTIFEDSPLGLDKWFVAVWSVANCKNGISSHELGRAIGVTQKTAWFMLHRIREAMRTGTFERSIDHATKYVEGRVHVNGLENFWSLLKRTLRGTYVSVAVWNLIRYLDEQAFRFNQRKTNDAGRFARVLGSVVGRRLTYRQLAAVDDCGFMGLT